MSATHPTRLETRTKESNARASQRVEQTPWRNESEGRRAPAEVGSRPRGARAHHRPVSPAPSGRWSVSEDPKDGELCLGRAKPEETLVEARSGPDVQIGRPTWV
ncbi:hypothetical protein PAMP_025051 [Pampus punctatissimus]